MRRYIDRRRIFDEPPRIALPHQFRRKGGAEGMATTMHHEMALNRVLDERQIANHIQNLVAHELIVEPQRIQNTGFAEDDRILAAICRAPCRADAAFPLPSGSRRRAGAISLMNVC